MVGRPRSAHTMCVYCLRKRLYSPSRTKTKEGHVCCLMCKRRREEARATHGEFLAIQFLKKKDDYYEFAKYMQGVKLRTADDYDFWDVIDKDREKRKKHEKD